MKWKIMTGISLFIYSSLMISYANMVYPIQTMSKVDCRFQDFLSLTDDCKMQLPVLKTADYQKYKNDYSLYRRVYTVLWGSTYNYGWDVGNGGHQGVDIASAKGTPVYAITDGKVILASNIAGRGNAVKIEHTVNGRKVYSNYAHLSKIDVTVGMTVKTNTKIGEIGNTGNSYGNHLHFQIDVAVSGKGPRYRSNCTEKNYDTIVNTNVCFSQLNTNTIDPLLFLETGGAIVKTNEIDKPKQEVISKEGMLSRKEILKREIDEFLRLYDVQVSITNLGGNIELGKSGNFRISVTDKRTKRPFTGSFPGDMNFKFDGNKFSIFPTGIYQIDNGFRDFKVTPKIAGKMSLDIYIGETFFKKVNFGVFDTKKSILPSSVVLAVSNTNVIGDNKKSILYFKDTYGLNILGFKFDGNYTLSSPDNSIKFCIKKAATLNQIQYTYNSMCDDKNFQSKVDFSYKDTIAGVLIFDYKVSKIGLNSFEVKSSSKSLTTRNVSGVLPYGLDVNSGYYSDIVKMTQLGIVSGLNKGYFLPEKELSTLDGINLLRALLEKKLAECNNQNCQNNYYQKIYELSKEKTDKYEYFTRGEYLERLGKYIDIKPYSGNDYIVFRDLDENLLNYSKNILRNQSWKDYYGQTRYFQPQKTILRAEAMFLLSQVLQ